MEWRVFGGVMNWRQDWMDTLDLTHELWKKGLHGGNLLESNVVSDWGFWKSVVCLILLLTEGKRSE